MKSNGKAGIVRIFSIIFVQVREKSGRPDYLVHMSFSLTLCMVVYKVIAQFVISKCELYHFYVVL